MQRTDHRGLSKESVKIDSDLYSSLDLDKWFKFRIY